MNVNLTPPVEPGKVASVAKNVAVGTETVGSEAAGGFFAQLHALIFGSSATTTPVTSVTSPSVTTATAVDEASADQAFIDTEGELTSANQALSSTADEDLLSEGEPASLESQTDLNTLSSSKGKHEKKAEESINSATAGLTRKTVQVMSDGDKLLGRLQEANQTLTNPNGKALPVKHDKTSVLPNELVADEASFGDTLPPDTQPELIVNSAISASQSTESSELVASGEVEVQDEAMASALLGGAIAATEHAQDPATVSLHPDGSLVTDELAGQLQTARLSQVSSESVDVASQSLSEGGNAPVTTAEAGKVAIPWATPIATENEQVALSPEQKERVDTELLKARAGNPVAQSLAQGAQQATAVQQTSVAQPSMTPTAPASGVDAALFAPQAATSNPMLNPATAVNPELTASSAMLAALGGKALAGNGDERRVSTESGGDAFAQQIAAAAGQGLGQTQTLQRSEAQAVQANATPLHLSKEMAAEQLAERVQVMLSKNLKNIDIRLDPPEMGRMHIRMNMQADGATVHFTVANQHARDALEQTMPRLREMLAQQGVQLGDTSVQQQSAGQQQRYSGQEQSAFAQSAGNEGTHSEENLDTDIKLDLNVATKRDGISYYA